MQPFSKSFREVMIGAQEESANLELASGEAVETVIDHLRDAGYAIRRICEPVDYHKPIAVLFQTDEGLHSRSGRFGAVAQTQAMASADLAGNPGWLVTWAENGLVRSGWFDGEGVSRLLIDYRVVNVPRPDNPNVSADPAHDRKAA